jgi:hypothetical protein
MCITNRLSSSIISNSASTSFSTISPSFTNFTIITTLHFLTTTTTLALLAKPPTLKTRAISALIIVFIESIILYTLKEKDIVPLISYSSTIDKGKK